MTRQEHKEIKIRIIVALLQLPQQWLNQDDKVGLGAAASTGPYYWTKTSSRILLRGFRLTKKLASCIEGARGWRRCKNPLASRIQRNARTCSRGDWSRQARFSADRACLPADGCTSTASGSSTHSLPRTRNARLRTASGDDEPVYKTVPKMCSTSRWSQKLWRTKNLHVGAQEVLELLVTRVGTCLDVLAHASGPEMAQHQRLLRAYRRASRHRHYGLQSHWRRHIHRSILALGRRSLSQPAPQRTTGVSSENREQYDKSCRFLSNHS